MNILIHKVFDREPELSGVLSLAGRNNLLPRLPHRYLFLRGFGSECRGGKWHCRMIFSPLDKLDPNAGLDDAINWRSWLGEGWEVVDS